MRGSRPQWVFRGVIPHGVIHLQEHTAYFHSSSRRKLRIRSRGQTVKKAPNSYGRTTKQTVCRASAAARGATDPSTIFKGFEAEENFLPTANAASVKMAGQYLSA